MKNRSYTFKTFVAFFAGLISTLFVPTPVGIIAMLDMAAYVLAIPIFIMNYPRYPKHFRRLLILSVLWVLNAVITDWYRGTPFMIAFKAEMILVDAVCLLVVGGWVVSLAPRAFMWFIAGVAISAVISLYKFQNGAFLSLAITNGYTGKGGAGAYLIDKQTNPLWANMFVMAGVFALRRFVKLPWPICLATFPIAGIYLLMHGGSRSGCLNYICGGVLATLYVYWPKMFISLFKRKVLLFFGVVSAAIFFNATYLLLARNGVLGEAGYRKLEEKASGQSSFLDDRNDIVIDWPFLWRSPIIGAGSQPIDRWGYIARNDWINHLNPDGTLIERDCFATHSCIVGAWVMNGLFGLLFWVYVLWLITEFLNEKTFVMGSDGPFYIRALMSIVWAILFSPFGWFRAHAVFFAAFVAYAMDPRFRAWLFAEGLSAKEKKKYGRLIVKK